MIIEKHLSDEDVAAGLSSSVVDLVHQIIVEDRDIKMALDLPDGQQVVLLLNSDQLQKFLSALIDAGMQGVAGNKKDTKSLMMKASINSALIAIGPMLIDLLWYGPADQKPKPGRKDDLLEWYTRYITTQLVGLMRDAKHLVHLVGSKVGQIDDQNIGIRVSGFYARPLSNTEHPD